MIKIKSPTRVTFALDIIRCFEDGQFRGYHELGIIKHQIALADDLYVEPYSGDRDAVECNDPRVPCDDTNICVKACALVRRETSCACGGHVRIAIDKKIPVMGGMAGGSANAAAMLRALDKLWDLRLTQEEFIKLGRSLGMDVPYFFTGGTAFDSEAGGVITPINTNLKFHIILAIPDFGVSTKEAYGSIDYDRVGKNVLLTDNMIKALSKSKSKSKHFHNDFEISVFEKYPRLKEIRDQLLKEGCLAAVMSGSGSTIIGIAADRASAEKIAARIDCRTIITETYHR